MTYELSETNPADAPAIARFLSGVFQLPPGAPLVDPQHMFWKYWAPRHDSSGPRSFVARHGATVRRLLEGGAHVGVGTDSPLVPPAIYYHLNLQAMVRYGATPHQALRSATRLVEWGVNGLISDEPEMLRGLLHA